MNDQEPNLTSAKPYLIRAIYEWILDNGLTPHMLVDAAFPGTQVPAEYVEDGQIVLNLAPGAVRSLAMGNETIAFGARFGGVARELSIPTDAVLGIFTRENRQGMLFPPSEYPQAGEEAPPAQPGAPGGVRPVLRPAGQGEGGGPKPPGKDGGKGKGGPTLKVVK